MSNQRTTFGKRNREQKRKEKALAKQERLAARRANPSLGKGPPIAWDEAVRTDVADVPADAPSVVPTDDAPTSRS